MLSDDNLMRLCLLLSGVPKNRLGHVIQNAFFDPFDVDGDTQYRMRYLLDEHVIDALEQGIKRVKAEVEESR
jgi:hypothetical protein